jgi:hypothetical protein
MISVRCRALSGQFVAVRAISLGGTPQYPVQIDGSAEFDEFPH